MVVYVTGYSINNKNLIQFEVGKNSNDVSLNGKNYSAVENSLQLTMEKR